MGENKLAIRTFVTVLTAMFMTVRGTVAGFLAIGFWFVFSAAMIALINEFNTPNPYAGPVGMILGLPLTGVMWYVLYVALGDSDEER